MTDDTTDTADDAGAQVVNGGSCDVADGAVDICWDDTHYGTCVNGEWQVRPCASGTVCETAGDGSVVCSWGGSE